MKCWLAAVVAVLLAAPLVALDGDPAMHDPSTIVLHNGKFYAYRHRQRFADLDLGRRLDLAARRHADAGACRAGAGAGRPRARRQQHLGA